MYTDNFVKYVDFMLSPYHNETNFGRKHYLDNTKINIKITTSLLPTLFQKLNQYSPQSKED